MPVTTCAPRCFPGRWTRGWSRRSWSRTRRPSGSPGRGWPSGRCPVVPACSTCTRRRSAPSCGRRFAAADALPVDVSDALDELLEHERWTWFRSAEEAGLLGEAGFLPEAIDSLVAAATLAGVRTADAAENLVRRVADVAPGVRPGAEADIGRWLVRLDPHRALPRGLVDPHLLAELPDTPPLLGACLTGGAAPSVRRAALRTAGMAVERLDRRSATPERRARPARGRRRRAARGRSRAAYGHRSAPRRRSRWAERAWSSRCARSPPRRDVAARRGTARRRGGARRGRPVHRRRAVRAAGRGPVPWPRGAGPAPVPVAPGRCAREPGHDLVRAGAAAGRAAVRGGGGRPAPAGRHHPRRRHRAT